MDKAVEGADAVRSVKRGRKPMVKADIGVVCPEGYVADGDYYKPEALSASQAYAMRIWSGQSIDVPVGERLTRVILGLQGQKMDIPDLSFLHPDATKLLYTPRTK